VQARLDALRPAALQEARLDVARQLGRLLFPGFLAAAGVARLPDVERYLRAAERRLERLPGAPGADAERMRTVHELEALHARRLAACPPDRPAPLALHDVRWLLEELRVSVFAQALGTRVPISPKRIRQVLDAAAS
jgi:ATP-dependent helicase HrpA